MQNAGKFFASMSVPFRTAVVASLIFIPLGMGTSAHVFAQEAVDKAEKAAAVAAVVPQQVRYAGKLANRSGETVEAEFRIYAVEQGGEPLWTETQRVTVAEDGTYTALLGVASATGLPQTVFAGGVARWLGVSVERGLEQDRVLLASVPYAMKSADAEALAGHPATDFVTQAQLAVLSGQGWTPSPALQSNTLGALTGSGTANTFPLWTGTYTQGNSIMMQGPNGIGIKIPAPATTLEVGGNTTLDGELIFPPVGTATTSAAQRSQLMQMTDSVWSTTTSGPVAQTFRLFTNPTTNDTASPTSVLNLQYEVGTAPAANILSIASNGNINFSPSQVFPIKGTGGGTITGITTTSPLTGSGTAGSVALGLSQSALVAEIAPALQTTFNGVYAQLANTNAFTAGQNIEGPTVVFGNSPFETMLSVQNTGDTFSTGIEALGSQTSGSIGVLGTVQNANGLSGSFPLLNSDDDFAAGIWADASDSTLPNESALIATADDTFAGIFFNNSATKPTISVLNNNASGSTGNMFAGIGTVLRASGPGGMCGINQTGNLACTGQVKTLVFTKNSRRQVETYTVQSAENWVEDYGSGQLNQGSATIQVESAFAETVNMGVEFHVFLTPGADCKGLYVTNKTGGSFEVHELGGGTSSIPFDYKIVAKRNGLESQRLVDVTERMKSESEAVRFKRLDHPLPRTRNVRPRHVAAANAAAANR